MNKQEIIDKLFDKLRNGGCRYPKWELVSIIAPFIEVIKETLVNGDDVRLTNLGKFIVKTKKGRKYYNVQTGSMDITKDKRMITFVQHRSLDSLHKNKEETKE